jgi:hypothetical protein
MAVSAICSRRCALAALLGAIGQARAEAPLPPQDLIVELRTIAAGHAQEGRAGTTTTMAVAQRNEAWPRVRVRNGATATLQRASGQPVTEADVWWTPWGPGAALRSSWHEQSQGLQVRPRWPGGAAPVLVEIAAQRVEAVRDDAGAAQWNVQTTLRATLGEWVDVAQLQPREAAAPGYRVATASRQRLLQLRVSLR